MCERMGGYTGNKKPGLLGRVNSFYEGALLMQLLRPWHNWLHCP